MTFSPLATAGFVSPRTVATSTQSLEALRATPFDFDIPAVDLTAHLGSSFALADEFGFADPNPLLSGLQSVFTVIGGLVGVTLLISVIVAVFVVPAAAKELEENTKSRYPDLWYEYQSKLEPGEDLSTRPDLMAEMGNKYQQLEMAEFDKAAAAVLEENELRKNNDSGGVIDVEITSQESKED